MSLTLIPKTDVAVVDNTGSTDTEIEGFILTRHVREQKGRTELEFWLHTESGPVCVQTDAQKSVFFVRQHDLEQVKRALYSAKLVFQHRVLELKTFLHEPVAALYFSRAKWVYRAKECLSAKGLECFESDIRLADRYLMERFIVSSALCSGLIDTESYAHPKVVQAKLKPSQYSPLFKTLSLDIECSEHGELYSIGLAAKDYKHVLMIGTEQADAPEWIVWIENEKALLVALVKYIHAFDPDIIIGWNLINFDIRLLIKRAEIHGVALNVGRGGAALHWRENKAQHEQGYASTPGRVFIDGIDALKSATYHFDSFSLEFVAQTLLNKGKKTEDVDNRLSAITHDFQFNKVSLAEYNLQDCILVLEIFEKTALLQYLTLRSQLTGLELDRVGGSVAAFINVYLPKLHRAGYIAPNLPEGGGLASPGGYVMNSKPGLYQHVIVLDYKSLYPSIIRTFLIDPLGLIEGLREPALAVQGFKGAYFSREKHFLPKIIEQLWHARDEAKLLNDEARSQAIKILMNSFYGVLGSGGCPFYDTRLASSITMRGQEIMRSTAEWIEDEGYEVIYGDTDSTFVHLKGEYSYLQATEVGAKLQKRINKKWENELKNTYSLTCYLDIEFETYFSQFLMPTIRGSSEGSKKRYAGIKVHNGEERLIFKGLETVRSDWTELAKQFQTELYRRIFNGEDVREYMKDIIRETLAGRYDDRLLYKKRLRRALSHYVKNVPPHVKAARMADQINKEYGKTLKYQNKAWIHYIMTVSGPQAIEHQSSPIDYQHYVEKQIRPIAEGILPFIGLSFDEITGAQLALFR